MTIRSRLSAGVAALAALLAGVAATAWAQGDLRATVRITPSFVHIGEAARYTGTVVAPHAADVRWISPGNDDAFSWGRPRVTRVSGGAADTFRIEADVQAFHLGSLTVPGAGFVDRARDARAVQRLPAARLVVAPSIPAADTAADLKPVRVPLRAPWWEAIPWAWVIGILVVGSGLIVWWHFRRRRVVITIVPAARRDPIDQALERLRKLREQKLPEAGQFGAHALEVTYILRRFLEDTTTRLRPGYTTGDLPRRLEEESVSSGEATVLVSLLKVLDRVKFARAPFTVEEARNAEDAVETYVRRRRNPSPRAAAA